MPHFSQNLIAWYQDNFRKLPWRETKSPYKIWLSEIILQQTRVNQGLPYYNSFIEKYETVEDLAGAKEDDILNLWQGLGYYSRARNLHFAAKQVVNNYNGNFPNSKKELLKLKGVGDYTASAIASFCFEEKTPVVDGNVFRFITRLLGINTPIDIPDTKKELLKFLNPQIEKVKASLFNQALMEFGAMQCIPKKPNCENCPFSVDCLAYNKDLIEEIPLKSKKVKTKKRTFHYLWIAHEGIVLIQKRTANDIWKNLFEFPLIENETIEPEELTNLLKKQFDINAPLELTFLGNYKHVLTHQKIQGNFWKLDSKQKINLPDTIEINQNDLELYALPRLITRFLDDFENNGLQLQIV